MDSLFHFMLSHRRTEITSPVKEKTVQVTVPNPINYVSQPKTETILPLLAPSVSFES